MSELMKAVAAAWNPETACKKRKEDFIYIGDSVMVARGRKIPQGTCGKVLRMFENPYDPVTYDMAKGALVLQTAGLDVQAIQYTNAKVQLELDNGNKVYTYLKNLEKTGGRDMNNLTIEEERTGKYKIPPHTIDFFNRELHGGITVYYWGTYVEAGDFGTFSKIISKLQLTGEQVEMFESDKELEEYCDKYGAMLQDIDEECTVSYQIDFIPKA